MAESQAIFPYLVKGQTAEHSPGHGWVTSGEMWVTTSEMMVPCDRLYAIENGLSGFDSAGPPYLGQAALSMLMRKIELLNPK